MAKFKRSRGASELDHTDLVGSVQVTVTLRGAGPHGNALRGNLNQTAHSEKIKSECCVQSNREGTLLNKGGDEK